MMVTMFGDLYDNFIYNPTVGAVQSIPEYLNTTFGWYYGQRWWAYGMMWAFNLLFLCLTAFGSGRINFTKR